jgi:BMFP domain-containing protein YqiC
LTTAIEKISAKLYDDAAKRAASLRKEAEAILQKASELESRTAVASESP